MPLPLTTATRMPLIQKGGQQQSQELLEPLLVMPPANIQLTVAKARNEAKMRKSHAT